MFLFRKPQDETLDGSHPEEQGLKPKTATMIAITGILLMGVIQKNKD